MLAGPAIIFVLAATAIFKRAGKRTKGQGDMGDKGKDTPLRSGSMV